MAPKARILAIDDQLYFRSFLEGLLAEEGYEVRTAQNAAQGLSLLETNGPFDLVVMDLVMPETDGVETVAELRARAPDQAIIVLTGVGDVRSVVAAMRQGASDYLLKPIERETLLQSIQSVLAQRRMRAENARLLDENLQFMGRLSLLERALPLLGTTDPAHAAHGVLELLCVEAGARDAVLWAREPQGSRLLLQAAFGESEQTTESLEWSISDPSLDRSLRSGVITRAHSVGRSGAAGPSLLVPFLRDGDLVAVARLTGCGEGGTPAGDLATCQKLGAILLANALRMAQLARSSLRDPRTHLPGRAYLEEVLATEVHKAHRFGRRLSCLCVQVKGLAGEGGSQTLHELVSSMQRTLRNTDVLCSDEPRRFWILVTDTDALGGVVLKRRVAECMADVRERDGVPVSAALGVASYPLDGENPGELLETARKRAESERASLVHELGLDTRSSLAEIGIRLLDRASPVAGQFVPEAAELVVGELTCRPRDRGLLFLAPGTDSASVLGPLHALGDAEIATEVFIATDADTVPAGPAVTAVCLPPQVSPETTWIVRFGEAPPYALVAGAPSPDGTRRVFHSTDPILVEHMTFRLRAEVGFGVRG